MLDLIAEANPVMIQPDAAIKKGQLRYLRLPELRQRSCRGMLTRFYGVEWTEAYIHRISF